LVGKGLQENCFAHPRFTGDKHDAALPGTGPAGPLAENLEEIVTLQQSHHKIVRDPVKRE
jgi:hypothetical protein